MSKKILGTNRLEGSCIIFVPNHSNNSYHNDTYVDRIRVRVRVRVRVRLGR